MCLSHSRRAFPAIVPLVVSALVGASPVPAAASASVSRQAFLEQYCVGCHNEKSKTGGIVRNGPNKGKPLKLRNHCPHIRRQAGADPRPC